MSHYKLKIQVPKISHKMRSLRTIYGILFWVLLFLTVFLFYRLKKGDLRKEIEANRDYSIGIIENVRYLNYRGYEISYSFSVENTKISAKKNYARLPKNELLRYKNFKVIYSKTNPEKNSILITKEDYEYFSLTYTGADLR